MSGGDYTNMHLSMLYAGLYHLAREIGQPQTQRTAAAVDEMERLWKAEFAKASAGEDEYGSWFPPRVSAPL